MRQISLGGVRTSSKKYEAAMSAAYHRASDASCKLREGRLRDLSLCVMVSVSKRKLSALITKGH